MTRPVARAALAALLPCLAAAACGDEGPQRLTETTAAAGVKFYNLGVGAPGVNFFAGDVKVTGANSVACTPLPAPPADSTCRSRGVEAAAGTGYGSAAAGGFYVALAPGQYTFTGRISAAADNGLAIATVPLALADGDRYSVFLTGTYDAATKQVDTFVLKDEVPAAVPGDSAVYLRAVSTVANAGPLVLIVRTQTAPVAEFTLPAVAYKTAGAWVPLRISGLVDLLAREEGSTAAPRALATGVSLVARRVYTVAIRGDNTAAATAATRLQATTAPNR